MKAKDRNIKVVLVVEDEKFLNKIVSLKLKKAGYSVISVEDGETAIQILTEQKPDLIWLDIYLPKKDGFEVLQWIRQNPKTKDLRVIIVSVSGSNEKIEQAKKMKVLDYYVKSNYKIDELIGRVNIVLGKK